MNILRRPGARRVIRYLGVCLMLVAALLAVGIVVSMSLLEALVALDSPWRAVLAGVIAGLLNLAAQALFGAKTSWPVDVSAGAGRPPERRGEST